MRQATRKERDSICKSLRFRFELQLNWSVALDARNSARFASRATNTERGKAAEVARQTRIKIKSGEVALLTRVAHSVFARIKFELCLRLRVTQLESHCKRKLEVCGQERSGNCLLSRRATFNSIDANLILARLQFAANANFVWFYFGSDFDLEFVFDSALFSNEANSANFSSHLLCEEFET